MKTGPMRAAGRWTPEQLAIRGWQVHAVGCTACREGCCPSGRTLALMWQRIRRANRSATQRRESSMPICARCDKPIEGEPERIMPDSPTGAAEVEVHRGYCKPAPRQTYPAGNGR